jgi:hypothetical protein
VDFFWNIFGQYEVQNDLDTHNLIWEENGYSADKEAHNLGLEVN